MEIINTHDLMRNGWHYIQKDPIDATPPGDDAPWFEDPDSAYSYWIKLDIFEPNSRFKHNNLVQQMMNSNAIQLNLKKQTKQPFSINIMKQHSIQLSIFEALALTNYFNHKRTDHWKISLQNSTNTAATFEFKHNQTTITIMFNRQKNNIDINQDTTHIGTLAIDIEQQVIEKIHGTLNDKRFIIDPIWTNKQQSLSSVKVNLGGLKTEIVQHPSHKQTLWHGNHTQLMTITLNKTYQINRNLFINRKIYEFSDLNIESVQWYCPWQRLPIDGEIIIKNKKDESCYWIA